MRQYYGRLYSSPLRAHYVFRFALNLDRLFSTCLYVFRCLCVCVRVFLSRSCIQVASQDTPHAKTLFFFFFFYSRQTKASFFIDETRAKRTTLVSAFRARTAKSSAFYFQTVSADTRTRTFIRKTIVFLFAFQTKDTRFAWTCKTVKIIRVNNVRFSRVFGFLRTFATLLPPRDFYFQRKIRVRASECVCVQQKRVITTHILYFTILRCKYTLTFTGGQEKITSNHSLITRF